MATLGMKTNGMITKFVNWSRDNSLASPNEKREMKKKKRKKKGRHDKNLDEKRIKNIINHTNSFNPQISHYTREHAPNRKYFPPELTVKYMWNEYASDSGNIAVSYSTYFKVFQTLNIGFSRPSQDECDVCQTWKNHEHGEGFVDGCATCVAAKEHLDSAREARENYQNEKHNCKEATDHIFLAADMQKVILLPKTSLKSQYFVSRLTIFNETFCDLNGSKDICVLWNEAVLGRSAADITSAYFKIFIKLSDYKKFTIWCDNCCSQNKNWTLICGI